MTCRVRSWSSASRARSFLALSNSGWYSASSRGVSRRVTVLPPILRVHSAYGPCSRGGSAWQRQFCLPQAVIEAEQAAGGGDISGWRPSSVSPRGEAYARGVIRRAGPQDRERAKYL